MDKTYQNALRKINCLRKACNRSPLELLPRGDLYSASDHPIVRALKCAGAWYVLHTVVWFVSQKAAKKAGKVWGIKSYENTVHLPKALVDYLKATDPKVFHSLSA